MKKYLLASASFVAMAVLAVPAAAEITVNAWIDYDKEVDITEILIKDKNVNLRVNITAITGASAAEANAITNQRIGPFDPTFQGPTPNPVAPVGNGPNTSTFVAGAFGLAQPADYYATTVDSVRLNTGVTQYNQDVGVGSNQANVLSAAVGLNAYFAEANNAAAQYITNNTVTETGHATTGNAAVPDIRRANLVNSVNQNVGVTNVNQNAGVFNNQLNAMSIAVAFGTPGGFVALAESDLGQWNLNSAPQNETNVARSANIATSVNGNTGVVMGNQAAGIMANQANMVSIAATVPSAPLNTAVGTFLNTSLVPNF